MPIETKEKEIDGYVYSVTQFPATEGLEVFRIMMNLLGGSIGELMSGMISPDGKLKTNLFDMEISGDALGKAISGLAMKLSDNQLVDLAFRMLKGTMLKAKDGGRFGDERVGRILFDNHFAGRLRSMIKLCVFIAEVNYADFFGDLGIGKAQSEN